MRGLGIGRWSRQAAFALGLAVVGSVGVLVAAPNAQAATSVPCTTRAIHTSLKALGDDNSYFSVTGGTFEHGTPGWSLYGAGLTVGNEPWKVLDDVNTTSLQLYPGGAASAPAMCVSTAEDSMRFFYRAPGVANSTLMVSVHVMSGFGYYTYDGTYQLISGGKAGWALSPRIPLPDIRDGSGQQVVTISFGQQGMPALWQLDDVQVDPWRSL
jgi:hypothetical protein